MKNTRIYVGVRGNEEYFQVLFEDKIVGDHRVPTGYQDYEVVADLIVRKFIQVERFEYELVNGSYAEEESGDVNRSIRLENRVIRSERLKVDSFEEFNDKLRNKFLEIGFEDA